MSLSRETPIHHQRVSMQAESRSPSNMETTDELERMYDAPSNAQEFFGDKMDEDTHHSIMRVYTQNLNGLNWDKDGGKWPYVCEAMDAISADVACFSELNVDTNRYNVRKTMEDICKRQFQQNSITMAASSHKTPTAYKPGGTAILATNALSTKIKSHTRDRMGRWTSISIELGPNKRLRIISAYQVCVNSRPGSNTAASHQISHIISETSTMANVSRTNPRKAFTQDLQVFIQQTKAQAELILLVGDFNEEVGESSSGMDTLASTCQLLDMFNVRLGSSTQPATYQRGKKRLDYILMSPELLPHVNAAGYDPFGYRIPSDHRGMYVDFNTNTLFHDELPALSSVDKRDFVSTSPEVICKYVTHKMSYLDAHRFFDRLDELEQLESANHDLAEALDRDLQRAAAHAARKCARKKKSPWSPKLAKAWADLHFYRMAHSAQTTPANYLPALHNLRLKWQHLPHVFPTELTDCNEKEYYN